MPSSSEIVTRPYGHCVVCNSAGSTLYTDLLDNIFGAPGQWRFKACRNPQCNLIWLDPMPLEQEVWKAYANYYTHDTHFRGNPNKAQGGFGLLAEGYLASRYGYFARSPIWKRAVGKLMYLMPRARVGIDSQVMYLQANHGGHVLDVGCGNGEIMAALKNLGWVVDGIDQDVNAASAARAKGLNVKAGSLEQQDYPENYFDAITLSHVIEHVSDPVSTFRECYRVLRPGGILMILTPNIESIGHRIYKRYWRGLEPPRHLHIFSCRSLSNLVAKAGFVYPITSTTIHWLAAIIGQSIHARCAAMQVTPSLRDKINIRLLTVLEILGISCRLRWGEEIVLLAKKP